MSNTIEKNNQAVKQKMLINAEEVKKALKALVAPGDVFNIRVLKGSTRVDGAFETTYNGIFNNIETAIRACVELKLRRVLGFYITLNPVSKDLMAVANNEFVKTKEAAAKDLHVLTRRWMLIDCDPIRASGVSSTDQEKGEAYKLAFELRSGLTRQGWPLPLVMDSGNGYHLLYAITLPAESVLVEQCLHVLASKFNNDKVSVDEKVFNPSRITKLYGTMTMKGAHNEELNRVHRYSKIIEIVDRVDVPLEKLEELAKTPCSNVKPIMKDGEEQSSITTVREQGDSQRYVEGFFKKYIKAVKLDQPKMEGEDIRINMSACPLCGRTSGNQHIIIRASGVFGFFCHNSACTAPSWAAIKKRYQPAIQKINESIDLPVECDDGVMTEDWWSKVFTKALDGNAFYCEAKDQWYMWNGEIFAEVHESVIREFNCQSVYKIKKASIDAGCEAAIDACNEALSARAMFNAIKLCKNKVTLIDNKKFDREAEKICAKNCVIDLRTGKALPFEKQYFFSKQMDVNFNPESANKCPRWDRFLEYTFSKQDEDGKWSPDFEKELYMMTLAGYCLTGYTSDQSVYFMYGMGGNGKSVFIDTIIKIMGKYAGLVNSETLQSDQNGSEARHGLADLDGVRLASVQEWPSDKAVNTALLKSCITDSEQKCRALYGNFFKFEQKAKYFFQCNNQPRIYDVDQGSWRRIKQVGFNRSVSQDEMDSHLLEKLKAEQEGILAQMVEGSIRFFANGDGEIKHHPDVIQDTKDYRSDANPLLEMLEDRCEINSKQRTWRTSFIDIKQAILEIASEDFKFHAAKLTSTLASQGLQRERRRIPGHSNPVYLWIGIKLRGN